MFIHTFIFNTVTLIGKYWDDISREWIDYDLPKEAQLFMKMTEGEYIVWLKKHASGTDVSEVESTGAAGGEIALVSTFHTRALFFN